MTESEVFESITNGGSSDFALLVDVLNHHGTWCLIGGLAVNCYVEPVYTLDAGVVVIASKLPAIKSELIKAGFDVEEFEHSLNARMSGSDLRIQISLDQKYQDFLTSAKLMKVLGQDVPVASLEDIVRSKTSFAARFGPGAIPNVAPRNVRKTNWI